MEFGESQPRELQFDVCALCTGTKLEFPVNSDTYTVEERAKIFEEFREKIEGAKSVLVVGTGATGIEMAGNLEEKY